MHASHASFTASHVGCISTSTYLLFAAFKRYNIINHHRRSFSGLNSQHQGNCRPAHHGFTTSISINIRGVFFGLSYFAFLGEIIKKRAVSAAALWKHGSRIDGSSKHYFQNCSLFFLYPMYRSPACCFSIAMPSIAAGCADYLSVVSDSLGVA